MTKVAVIGAGLSGLVVARQLQAVADVTVFEKSRGVGGRMATRYAGDFEFDRGAQFFTARTKGFRSFLQPLLDKGIVAPWQAQFAEFDRDNMTTLRAWADDYPHFVGAPRMNSIGKALSADLNVVFETAITAIARDSNGWTVSDGAGSRSGPFDWLVVSSPAPQTAALTATFPELVAYCGERQMLGCFALMLGFSEPVNLQWQAALVHNADISWMSVNNSKPFRDNPFALVVHSTNAWADAHMEDDIELVQEHLLDEVSLVAGKDMRSAAHREVHRWRYANIARQAGPSYYLDEHNRLAACGDWCVLGRIEAAFTSANDLAGSLVERL
jgi:predicted NAD/FAD-dependent oxidoreductase